MKKKELFPNRILTKKEPEKSLLLSLRNNAGRQNSGRITVRHQGGGVKKMYRIIDFAQSKIGMTAKVIALEYDPYRTAFLMLLEYEDKEKVYQLAPQGIKIGDEIICQEAAEIKDGNRLKIKNVPVGTMIYNIELIPGRGGKMIRSAGSGAKVLAHEGKFSHLEMPSREIRMVFEDCYVSIGTLSHPEWRYEVIGKAGSSRLKGKRPSVRGKAMNPCDHPHGGGEGNTSIGLPGPKTPWGRPARGVKTRKSKWTDRYIIKRRVSKI